MATVDPAIFARNLRYSVKTEWVTRAIVAVNVALFAYEVTLGGVSLTSPTSETLVHWGANFGLLTIEQFQPWRLFTAMFLHIGLIHIGFNMFALWRSGPFIERVFGNLPYLALYLIAGFGGSLATIIVHPQVISAGASGAIFGVFGGLGGYLVKERKHVPPPILAALRSNLLQFVVYNVVLGFAVPQIDMSAHVGGLVTGFLAGAALACPMDQAGFAMRNKRAAIVSVIAVIVLGAITAALLAHSFV